MTLRARLPRRCASFVKSFVKCGVRFVSLAGRAYCRIWRRDARRAKALSLVGLVVVLAPRAASHRRQRPYRSVLELGEWKPGKRRAIPVNQNQNQPTNKQCGSLLPSHAPSRPPSPPLLTRPTLPHLLGLTIGYVIIPSLKQIATP